MAELLHAGHTLNEIARFDDVQMKWLLFRERDEYGALVRRDSGASVGVAVSYEDMYRSVYKNRGFTQDEVEAQWQDFLARTPSMRKLIARRQKRKNARQRRPPVQADHRPRHFQGR